MSFFSSFINVFNANRHFLCNRNFKNEPHYKQLRNQFKYQVRLAKRQILAEGAKSGGKSSGLISNLLLALDDN